MRKVGYYLLWIILILAPGRLFFAQDKMVLTLEKSIEMALSQNPYHLASRHSR
jgi:hypothetical protein